MEAYDRLQQPSLHASQTIAITLEKIQENVASLYIEAVSFRHIATVAVTARIYTHTHTHRHTCTHAVCFTVYPSCGYAKNLRRDTHAFMHAHASIYIYIASDDNPN